jgi:hypothetical protein
MNDPEFDEFAKKRYLELKASGQSRNSDLIDYTLIRGEWLFMSAQQRDVYRDLKK